jgi:hypothetical protein
VYEEHVMAIGRLLHKSSFQHEDIKAMAKPSKTFGSQLKCTNGTMISRKLSPLR